MITINLLPDIKQEFLKTRRTQAKVISGSIFISVASLGVIAFLGFWCYVVQHHQKEGLTGDIKNKISEIDSIADAEKYVTIQNQLANISALHGSKSDFSRFVNFLSVLNPKEPNNIKISNMSVSVSEGENILTIQGETAKIDKPDLTSFVVFRDTLKNAILIYRNEGEDKEKKEKLFDDVVVENSGLSTEGETYYVGFKINLKYNKNAFLNSVKNPRIQIPHKDTTLSKNDTPGLDEVTKEDGSNLFSNPTKKQEDKNASR